MSSMSSEKLSLANIQEFVGRELGVSDWVTIDQERINQFAACTGDHQWIYVDVERAKRESPFGTTIAHGYLTLAMLAQTSFEVWIQPAGIKQAFNYGIDRVRFIGAVKSGARIRNRIKLLSAEEKGDGRTLITPNNPCWCWISRRGWPAN